MHNWLKRELQSFYQIPEPVGKDKFLRKIADQEINIRAETELFASKYNERSFGRGKPGEITLAKFLWIQLGYIRKWNWLTAAGIFLFALFGGKFFDQALLWCLSAAVPFLALAAVSEISRSVRYGMQELELASRFSLRTVTAARMGILGIADLLLLGFLSPAVCRIDVNIATAAGIVQAGGDSIRRMPLLIYGIYILIPYFLTAFLNLLAVRKIHGRESLYVCMGITALVSGICVVSGIGVATGSLPMALFFEGMGKRVWSGIIFLLVILTGRELAVAAKNTNQMQEIILR